MIQWAALSCGVALAGLVACQKTDTGLQTAGLSENALKAASQTYTSEVFDEVMEIGDETLILYEKLIHGKDTLKPDSLRTGPGHHGLHGWFSRHDKEILDSLFRNGMHSKFGHCTKVAREWSGDTLVTTINYGADSCVGFDGKVRSGKIIMTSIGDYWKGDAVVTFTCQDYFVDGNQVTGTSKVTSTINADGNRESAILEEGSIILADGGGTILWSSEKTRILKKGSDTFDRKDDTVEVTGLSSGTLVSGNTFTSQTQTPLVRSHQKDCMGVFISGITAINISDGTAIVVDYGDGTCDNLATITTDGVTETITLERLVPIRGRWHGRRH